MVIKSVNGNIKRNIEERRTERGRTGQNRVGRGRTGQNRAERWSRIVLRCAGDCNLSPQTYRETLFLFSPQSCPSSFSTLFCPFFGTPPHLSTFSPMERVSSPHLGTIHFRNILGWIRTNNLRLRRPLQYPLCYEDNSFIECLVCHHADRLPYTVLLYSVQAHPLPSCSSSV